MKPRSPIARASKKVIAANGGKLPFSSISPSGKGVKRKPRKPSETLRIYGPPSRRAWMKTLPCSACHVVGYSEGAHVLGIGGMGRKADADTQAPLCGPRPRGPLLYLYMGCHILFDRHRDVFDRKFPDFNPAKAAADTEAQWRESQA